MGYKKRSFIVSFVVVVFLLLVFLVATGCKYILNGFQSYTSKDETGIPTSSISEASERGTLIANLTCVPNFFTVDGHPVLFSDIWIEQASEPEPAYVWFKRYKSLNYYWLNFRITVNDDYDIILNRLQFKFSEKPYNDPPTNDMTGVPKELYSALFKEVPTKALELVVIDRNNQNILCRTIISHK